MEISTYAAYNCLQYQLWVIMGIVDCSLKYGISTLSSILTKPKPDLISISTNPIFSHISTFHYLTQFSYKEISSLNYITKPNSIINLLPLYKSILISTNNQIFIYQTITFTPNINSIFFSSSKTLIFLLNNHILKLL